MRVSHDPMIVFGTGANAAVRLCALFAVKVAVVTLSLIHISEPT